MEETTPRGHDETGRASLLTAISNDASLPLMGQESSTRQLIASGVVAAMLALSACNPSNTEPTTEPSTPATPDAPTITTPPPTTHPPTTAPRTKATAQQEVLATIDLFHLGFAECVENADTCDPETAFEFRALPSSPIRINFSDSIRAWKELGATVQDSDLIVRTVETVSLSDELDVASVTFCEIDPAVVITRSSGEPEIIDDQVGLTRLTYELVYSTSGSWIIGPTEAEGGLRRDLLPKCLAPFEGGTGTPWLDESPPDESRVQREEAPPTPQRKAEAEDQALMSLSQMHSQFDQCRNAPHNCAVEEVVAKYSLPDTTVDDWFSKIIEAMRQNEVYYLNASEIVRTVQEIDVGNDADSIRIVQCHDDNAPFARIVGGEEVVPDRERQRLRFTYDLVNIHRRGWTVIMSSLEEFNGEDAPECFNVG